jgi:hypothetical protein
MNIEELKTVLKNLNPGEYYEYPVHLPPDEINKVLTELYGKGIEIMEDVNGCDLDWSMIDYLNIDGDLFSIWGCVTMGSFMFEKNILK